MIVIDQQLDDTTKRPLTRHESEPAQRAVVPEPEMRPLNSYAENPLASSSRSSALPPPSGPPPAYPGYQAIVQTSHHSWLLHPAASHQRSTIPPPRTARRESTARRFWKTLCTALAIYALGIVLLGSWARSTRSRRLAIATPDDWSFQVPSNGSAYTRLRCATPSEWEFINEGRHGALQGQSSAILKTPFRLPLEPHLDLFFLANSGITGRLEVVEDDTLSDYAEVHVRVDYYEGANRWTSLEDAEVCHYGFYGLAQGIGLSVDPASNRLLDLLHFDLIVAVPPRNHSPLTIPELAIRMPHMNIDIAYLAEHYFIDQIAIHTKDGEVEIGSLAGGEVEIQTTNGAIRGAVTAHRNLIISTTNARIDVDVKTESDMDRPVDVILSTTNSPLRAKLTLVSSSPSATGGSYRVLASTTEARLDIAYVSTPLDSTLQMVAKTTSAPAMVHLHAAYEGNLELKTSKMGNIDVKNVTLTDPSGQGRERKLVWDHKTGRGQRKASLGWGSLSQAHMMGSVSIQSDEEIHVRI